MDMWTVIAITSTMTFIGLLIGNHDGYREGFAKGKFEGYKECADYVRKEIF